MASKVQIFNMSLGMIGVNGRVDDENENTPEAIACRLFYDQIRGVVQTARMWPNLTREFTLQDLGSPPDNWLYRYAYPADCIYIDRIKNPYQTVNTFDQTAFLGYRAGIETMKVPFEIQDLDDAYGRCILTNQENAVIIGNRDETDTQKFGYPMTHAIVMGLGAHISMPLQASPKTSQYVMGQFNDWLAEASVHAMRERQDEQEAVSEFVSARF